MTRRWLFVILVTLAAIAFVALIRQVGVLSTIWSWSGPPTAASVTATPEELEQIDKDLEVIQFNVITAVSTRDGRSLLRVDVQAPASDFEYVVATFTTTDAALERTTRLGAGDRRRLVRFAETAIERPIVGVVHKGRLIAIRRFPCVQAVQQSVVVLRAGRPFQIVVESGSEIVRLAE